MVGLVPASHDRGGGAQVGDAGIGAGADENPVDLGALDRLAGLEALILEGGFPGAALLLWARARIGNGAVHGDDMFGAGAPGDLRRHVLHVDRVLAIELGVGIGRQGAPMGDGAVPHRALGRVVAAGEVFVGRVVGRHHAGARAHLDREVAEREARLDRQRTHAGAGVFDREARAGGGAELADQVEDHVFGRDTGLQRALEAGAQALGLPLYHGLRGDYVDQLGRADAEGQRAHAAVSGRMAVAADQRGAGQGQALLGAHDVDDALSVLAEVEQLYAVGAGGLAHRPDQRFPRRMRLVGAAGLGRHGVVWRAVGQTRLCRRIALVDGFLQRLAAGHVVQQQPVDVQQHEAAAEIGDDVAIPDLVEKCLAHLAFLCGCGC